MRCLITGTRFGRPDVWYWMLRFVRRFGVPEFVLGDNKGAWRTHHRADGTPLERVWYVGVDALALDLCEREGWPYEVHVAEWGIYGRSAGFRRDEKMVAACSPGDYALAFPSPIEYSRGTWTTAGLANDARLNVFVVPHVRVLRPRAERLAA